MSIIPNTQGQRYPIKEPGRPSSKQIITLKQVAIMPAQSIIKLLSFFLKKEETLVLINKMSVSPVG